jgi:hypothetical protein
MNDSTLNIEKMHESAPDRGREKEEERTRKCRTDAKILLYRTPPTKCKRKTTIRQSPLNTNLIIYMGKELMLVTPDERFLEQDIYMV